MRKTCQVLLHETLQIRKKVGNGERKLHNELIMDVQKIM
jgi:hypothetical protein